MKGRIPDMEDYWATRHCCICEHRCRMLRPVVNYIQVKGVKKLSPPFCQ